MPTVITTRVIVYRRRPRWHPGMTSAAAPVVERMPWLRRPRPPDDSGDEAAARRANAATLARGGYGGDHAAWGRRPIPPPPDEPAFERRPANPALLANAPAVVADYLPWRRPRLIIDDERPQCEWGTRRPLPWIGPQVAPPPPPVSAAPIVNDAVSVLFTINDPAAVARTVNDPAAVTRTINDPAAVQ